MNRLWLLIIISFLLCLVGCKQNSGETEIIVQLSDAEYFWPEDSYTIDSLFLVVYDYAVVNHDPEKSDFLSTFSVKLSEIDPEARLAKYFITVERISINFNSTNQEVLAVLNEEVELAREETIKVLAERIKLFSKPSSALSDLFDKTEVTVTELPEKNNFSFTVNRKVDPALITTLLESNLKFGLWETYELSMILEALTNLNSRLRESSELSEILDTYQNVDDKSEGSSLETYIMLQSDEETAKWASENPIFSFFTPSVTTEGVPLKCNIGMARIRDTTIINKYFSTQMAYWVLPRDIKFMWEKNPSVENNEYINLFAIKVNSRDGLPWIDGRTMVKVFADKNNDLPAIKIKLNSEGARMLSRMTRENIGRHLVFAANNEVYANSEVIDEVTNGAFEMYSNLMPEDVNVLNSLIGAGTLPKFGIKVIDIK